MKNRTADILSADHITPSLSSEEVVRLVLNSLEDSFLIINKNLDIVITSERSRNKIREYFGVSVSLGTSILVLAPVDRHAALIELYQEVFRGAEKRSETRFVHNGQIIFTENHFRPAYNDAGDILGAIVTSRDVTESKKAESVLKEVEERWRFALEGGKQGVWDWNIQTGEAFYSFKKLYTNEGHQMRNRIEEWQEMIHPDDRHKVNASIEKHIASADPYMESTYRIRTKDGEDRWILSRGMIISHDEQGRPLRMIGTHTDVTEQMITREKLRVSQQEYKTLFDANPLPCWIYQCDTFRFMQVNEAAVLHYGYAREEFLQLTVFDLQPEDRREQVRQSINHRSRRKSEAINNWQHCKKNGERIFVDLRITTIEYGGQTAKLVVAHDVTGKVAIERALRESNERFTYAAKAASEALWEWDVHSQEFYVSPAYTDIFGWKVNEQRRFDEWHEYIHPDDRAKAISSYYDALENTGVERWHQEYRYRKADGSYAVVIDRAIVLRDENGKALKVVGAIQDITGQKEVEAELKKSNERFLLVSRATSDAIYDWDLHSNELHWGEGLQTLFGFEPNAVPIAQWESLIHHEDRARIVSTLHEALAEAATSLWKGEYRFARADGSYSYVLDRGFIIRDGEGKALRVIGSIQDMTERKYHEQLLTLERTIFQLSTNPKIDFQFMARQLLAGLEAIHTDAFTSMLLLREDDTVEMLAAPRLPGSYTASFCGARLGPGNGSCGAAMWRNRIVIVEDIDTDPLWANYRALAGEHGLKACTSLPVVNSSGKVMGSFAVYYKQAKTPSALELATLERIRNILRILMEQYWSLNEIRVANERFDIMMKATHDLVWDWNLETNTIYRNETGLKQVYGLSSNEPIKGIYQWLGRIHPDDQSRAEDVINDVLRARDQDSFDMEYRFRGDDGTYAHVYDRGLIIRDREGKPVRMIGAAQDVTERKRLETELLQNELERQRAINQATVDTQEQERTEIGKELHDNVNQVLTTTKLYLDLAQTNAELKDELIIKSSKNIVSVINEIRQLSRSLMDPSIGDLGLVDSINDLIENINLTRKLHVDLSTDRKIERMLNKNQKLTIFRIIQEALNNAIKHARAGRVSVSFKVSKGMACVSIQDDGIGFHPALSKKGVGLKNIQNRIYLINGTHTIQSAPGKGCKIAIKFPIIHQP